MPVLKKLDKTISKIEGWQEECAKLQYALGILLSEAGGTSIADVAVAPEGMGDVEDEEKKKKKKKKLDEATVEKIDPKVARLAKRREDANPRTNVEVTSSSSAVEKDTRTGQIQKVIKAGDEEDTKNSNETEHSNIAYTTPKPVIIKKTLDILKNDQRLQTLINKFYDFRSAGNVGKSDEMKTIIDEFINSRGMDPLTVYASYDFALGDEDDTEEEPELEEPTDSEDDSDETEEEK